MVPVINGNVRPREVAFQIKSGRSYISANHCHLQATAAHVYFWAEHDLVTVGVIYDPVSAEAWWIDLQAAARRARASRPKSGKTFTFAKALWNRFDDTDFGSVLLPALLGEAPTVSLERLCTWVTSDDIEMHDLGVRAIRARHYREAMAWDCLINEFKHRSGEKLSLNLPIGLAKLLGHDDLGFYTGEIDPHIRATAIAKVMTFGADEIAKLISMLPDTDFERPSIGYSLMPLFGQRAESPLILAEISASDVFDLSIREIARGLLDWYTHDPEWWAFWRRDGGKRK